MRFRARGTVRAYVNGAMSRKPNDSALVVMETGSQWPAWLARYEPVAPCTRVIVQQDNESLYSLAQRTAERLGELSHRGESLDLAIVACSERCDDGALSARRAMAHAILSTLAESGQGSLWFTESQRQSGGARQAISVLAGTLAQEWENSGVTVSVRFGHPSRPPQQMGVDQGLLSGIA